MAGVLIGRRMKGNSVGSDYNTRANTRHLTRILIALKEFGSMNYTKLRKYVSGQYLGDGLRWLVNHKLIAKTTNSFGKGTYYCLEN